MGNNQKLELTWFGKDKEIKIEPRILIEDKEKSNCKNDPNTENMLIHGDNLLALKALESKYAGKVKCVYIDPPYNTGNAFEYYDDNREHSIWLNLMRSRLVVLFNLLKDGGSIWVSIDDIESHRLRMLLDEVFGSQNFVADITYERSGSAGLGQGGLFVNNSEHIMLYSKGYFEYNEILGSTPLELKTMKRYNKVLVNEGKRELVATEISKSNGLPIKIYKHTDFEICTISLRDYKSREKEIRAEFVEAFEKLFRTNNVQKENKFQNDLMTKMDKKYLYTVDYTPSRGKYKDKKTTLYYYNSELFAWLKDTAFVENNRIVKTNKLTTVWRHEDIPKADLANEGTVDFPRGKKPEQLIKRIISISSNEGDLVLDSFLGSGTTAAVAQKMNRRYIGIEMGDHAYTHCKVRLDKVIDGTDQGGISKAVNWQGGGAYKFYDLAPTLINKDAFGEYVINKAYDAAMIASAVALHEGFTYKPDTTLFWKQSQGNENSYLFVTTRYVDAAYLSAIASTMQDDEYLIIACKSFESGLEKLYPNITIKKIPQMLFNRCEFDHDNYNLNIVNPPVYDDEEDEKEEDGCDEQ
jgi:hypothetical protein